MDEKKQVLRAYFSMILSVGATSTANILIKTGLNLGWAPAAIAGYRMIIAAVIMVIVASSSQSCRKEFRTLRTGDILKMILAGIFMGIHFVGWSEALKYTSPINAIVLACIQPVFLMFAGVLFFKEKLNWKVLLCALIPIIGVLIISLSDITSSHGGSLLGDMIALSMLCFYISQLLLGRSVRQRVSVKLYTAIVYSCCTIAIFCIGLIQGAHFTGMDPRGFLVSLALALLVTLAGHNIIIFALKYLRPAAVVIFQMGEVVLTTLWTFLFFQEVPRLLTVLGGVIIMSGVYLFVRTEEKEKQRLLLKQNI